MAKCTIKTALMVVKPEFFGIINATNIQDSI
jgi:hypothetical protein